MDDSAKPKRKRSTANRTGCAVEATISVIGGLWKPVILFHLLDGKLRFNAICRLTPAATPRMITLQLRELEADGVINRIIYPEIPPKVEYELTELGKSLEPVLVSMCNWGTRLQELSGLLIDTGSCRSTLRQQELIDGLTA
ncbi:transcriptional regulator [Rhizobium laguerreae]|uniref:winged helix-turn-helix transcriptional regulator n=1 Tax=Rhizobium laguerreae TaxID=1076926 RepID=UPI00103C7705|nr:helix-turn-helix domain-containing protein [Rhizobium laguerreae]MBY3300072.1 helix-turn-helix transcriptional regulator [Rhizobium laguerreae]MBY3397729.1 helix-turn-helix transcriptional regulator [Rhizobium laguerreae]MBY3496895.1 helix-turn-helix transcriptional regulator [Rhizobium laguerreae]MBY3544503.1 helix-turn-helix transcriptional regulator [Rhizobium laguerreae]MBY3551161.1 helix-turn-helix transcriptional regulator [Rhizobium laguerreae]